MGIRGDMEAPYWEQLGHDSIRGIVNHFFDCLKDPNVWQRMQKELGLTPSDLRIYFEEIDWLQDNMVTRV